jgi:hypothetical protein
VATTHLGGRVGFVVRGKNGGAWSVDLRVPGGAWQPTVDPRSCQTTVFATKATFAGLFLHPDKLPAWLRAGSVRVEGDLGLLLAVARLCQTAAIVGRASPVALRLALPHAVPR